MTACYQDYKNFNAKDKNSKIQRMLNKLISEEWLAGQMYFLFNSAINITKLNMVEDIMKQTAVDEIDDHHKNLVSWAKCNGYDVPCSIKDFCKYADERVVKQFEAIKRDKDAEEYVQESIKAEQYALESYQAALELDDLNEPEFVLLKEVVCNNYYDEVQHYNDFMFMFTAFTTMIDKVVA